jgi:hypothetical protein
VSASYLGLVLNSPPIDDKTRLSVLIQYPFYMDQLYQSRINTSYPDAQRSYTNSFSSYNSDYVTISQDPLAIPYVRVWLYPPGGEPTEFSINRDIVERLLKEGEVTGTNLMEALRKYSYRLPEDARSNFRYLNSTQIMAMAAESIPAVAKQEFVKSRRWYGLSPTNRVAPTLPPAETIPNAPPTKDSLVHTVPDAITSSPTQLTIIHEPQTASYEQRTDSPTSSMSRLALAIMVIGLIGGACLLIAQFKKRNHV